MNHADAIELGAVEKYVLGELSVAERDEFEAHYFECPECARHLQVLEAVRQTVKEPPQGRAVPLRPWIERPAVARWAMAAAVALGLLVSYQNLYTLPQLRQAAYRPRLMATIQPDVRFRGTPAAAMEFRVPLQFPPGFSSYRVELQSADGRVLSDLRVSAAEGASSEGIGFARTPDQSGNLQVVLYGENASLQPQEVKRHRIHIP
ncbi:MAG: zf-HC2 domain-containing protein [Bryobacterales bacterium]|nr:zf-HC2 domain-containing protein [Bryobacterales bacterium]